MRRAGLALCLVLMPGGLALGAEQDAPPAAASAPADPELSALKTAFEFGRYREVLDRANARLERGGLSDDQRLELHRLAGLSAYNLGQREQAARHFEAVLRLSPEYALDPFSVPPPTIRFFEELRERLGPELAQIREERRLRAERERQEQEERQLRTREEALTRERLEDLTRRTVQRVDHHSIIPNFVPFGVGQFEENRTSWGVAFAVSEGVLAGASIVSFWVYQLAILTPGQTYTFSGNRPPNQVTVEGIPPSRVGEARFWNAMKIGAGLGFYGVWAAGVTDALLHFREETVTTVVQDAAPPTPPPSLRPRASLFITQGGGGVAVGAQF